MAAVRAHATRTVAPRHHRRVSGPLRPAAVPGSRAGTVPRPAVRGRSAGFERIRALPDHRLVDGLLRSRAWIVIVAVLLGGIVAMQVSLLKLNAGISRAVETTATLERQNADLEDSIARLSSGERIRAAALATGMVAPAAGDIGFLRARGDADARLAAARMQPPSESAKAMMASGGQGAATAQTTLTAPAPATVTTAPVTQTTTAPPATGTSAQAAAATSTTSGQG
jgi:cell division protein FtsB